MTGKKEVLILGTGLIWGFVAAKLIINVPLFTLDHEVDVVGLSALLTTIVVSIVFYRRFEKVKHSDQLKKTAVIERLKRSFHNLERLESLCEGRPIGYVDVVKTLKRCRNEFDAYVDYVADLSSPVSAVAVATFQLSCTELKDLLTNTPHTPSLQSEIEIVENSIRISANRQIEVENVLGKARRTLFTIEKAVILDVS